jgi:hypothetical protein
MKTFKMHAAGPIIEGTNADIHDSPTTREERASFPIELVSRSQLADVGIRSAVCPKE